jgi:hypothetical protein
MVHRGATELHVPFVGHRARSIAHPFRVGKSS